MLSTASFGCIDANEEENPSCITTCKASASAVECTATVAMPPCARSRGDVRAVGGNDALEGGRGGDVLRGGDGDDGLNGGFDPDQISGGNGNDVITVVSGGTDTVDCGPGFDRVTKDRFDHVAANCESVG